MGMPGVFAWGTFDTWSPGYLMFMAATHNGISRLYETFGNGGRGVLPVPGILTRDLRHALEQGVQSLHPATPDIHLGHRARAGAIRSGGG